MLTLVGLIRWDVSRVGGPSIRKAFGFRLLKERDRMWLQMCSDWISDVSLMSRARLQPYLMLTHFWSDHPRRMLIPGLNAVYGRLCQSLQPSHIWDKTQTIFNTLQFSLLMRLHVSSRQFSQLCTRPELERMDLKLLVTNKTERNNNAP